MKRSGFSLPWLMILTLLAAAVSLYAAARLSASRERAMVSVATSELHLMMAAIDKYALLYSSLPRRLNELNKVGYREGGGIVVCAFQYNSGGPRGEFIALEVKHRSGHTSVRAHHPSGVITEGTNDSCKSVRRS